MEKNIAGKKTTTALLLTLFYFPLSEGGCNLVSGNVYRKGGFNFVSGNVYGREQSALHSPG